MLLRRYHEKSEAEQAEFDLQKATVAELKAHAKENGIDLAGASKKAEIVAAIEAAQPAPAEEHDSEPENSDGSGTPDEGGSDN